MFAFLSAPIDTPLLYADSLADNMLCGVNKYGGGTYTSEGITKLCEALKGSVVTSLKCAPAPVPAFLSTPIDTPPSLGSLDHNQLCGLNDEGNGTYTAEGITKLCEALKGSAVTSLKCAAGPAPRAFAFLSAPIDTPDISPSPLYSLLTV